jgi:lambda repressor-like predicted transcriptional regulator
MLENPIAQRIQERLDETGIDLAEAVRRAQVSYHTIRNLWRRPTAKLSAQNADRLAAILGTTARFILFGEAPAAGDRRALVVAMYDEFDDEARRQMEDYALFLASRRGQNAK